MEPMEQTIAALTPLGERVCRALSDKAGQLGVASATQAIAPWAKAEFALSRDPYSGADSLIGTWRDRHGQACGKIMFHGDGSAYAEFDILQPHPRHPGMIIVAIEAWLRDGVVKTDLQLFPEPGSEGICGP
ncbi:hypothetical protein [Acidithiobacillus sp.]